MIKTFRDEDAERIWQGYRAKKIPPDIQHVARRKLRILNSAESLEDVRVPPANRLEALKGQRRGQHSIRINKRWRICFRWHRGDAYDVEVVDYHR